MAHGSETHLQDDFQSVERGSAGSGHAASHTSSHQVAPPHSGLQLSLCEVIWNDDIFSNIDDLQGKGKWSLTEKAEGMAMDMNVQIT